MQTKHMINLYIGIILFRTIINYNNVLCLQDNLGP